MYSTLSKYIRRVPHEFQLSGSLNLKLNMLDTLYRRNVGHYWSKYGKFYVRHDWHITKCKFRIKLRISNSISKAKLSCNWTELIQNTIYHIHDKMFVKGVDITTKTIYVLMMHVGDYHLNVDQRNIMNSRNVTPVAPFIYFIHLAFDSLNS